MKKICLLLMVVLCVSHASAQDPFLKYRNQYECAYQYIKNKIGEKKCTISHNIVDLDRWFFANKLKDMPDKDSILQSYSMTHLVFEDDIYSEEIVKMQGETPKRPDCVLFFSPMSDDMITVQVVPFHKRRHKLKDVDNYKRLSSQNTVDAYLFVFSEDGCLLKTIISENVRFCF